CGLRIKADGGADFRIPEFRSIGGGAPRSLHYAKKAIRAFYRGRESAPAKHHHFGSVGDRCRSRAAGQRNFRIPVGDQIRIHGSHGRIRSLLCLRRRLACCARQAELNKKDECDELEIVLSHGESPIDESYPIFNGRKWPREVIEPERGKSGYCIPDTSDGWFRLFAATGLGKRQDGD